MGFVDLSPQITDIDPELDQVTAQTKRRRNIVIVFFTKPKHRPSRAPKTEYEGRRKKAAESKVHREFLTRFATGLLLVPG
ncbi:unnamed protein product [Linum trigynum]|uniref:Uncharacterized protein n=1 Tax=Linum trigynum TaxID=586398 RepID=A0AAV2GVT7_9ROSI